MKITMIGARMIGARMIGATMIGGALLLAGCGASDNPGPAPAKDAAPTATPDPAPGASGGGGIMSPHASDYAPSRSQPFDASLPIPGPPELSGALVGRWGRQNSCAETMQFFADGRLTIPDGRAGTPQWRVSTPGRLELIENGSSQTGNFELRDAGRTLRLINPSGRATDFIRC